MATARGEMHGVRRDLRACQDASVMGDVPIADVCGQSRGGEHGGSATDTRRATCQRVNTTAPSTESSTDAASEQNSASDSLRIYLPFRHEKAIPPLTSHFISILRKFDVTGASSRATVRLGLGLGLGGLTLDATVRSRNLE